jgi:hypothetical protein
VLVYGAIVSTFIATSPSYLTQTIQVWEQLLGPQSGPPAGSEKIYKLDVKYPANAYIDDDVPIKVLISEVLRDDPNSRIQIRLTSQSFKFSPDAGISVPLKNGQEAVFIASASAPGNRSIRVVDQFWITDAPDIRELPFPSSGPQEVSPRKPDAVDARIINITIRERPIFLVLDRALMKDIQTIAAVIGIPGLLIFFLSGLRDKRLAQKKGRDESRRITGPGSGYTKRRLND